MSYVSAFALPPRTVAAFAQTSRFAIYQHGKLDFSAMSCSKAGLHGLDPAGSLSATPALNGARTRWQQVVIGSFDGFS